MISQKSNFTSYIRKIFYEQEPSFNNNSNDNNRLIVRQAKTSLGVAIFWTESE